jgi:hypothetical protein
MAQDQFTQEQARTEIQKIMALVQAVWDNPNPGPREKAMLEVTLSMLTLQNPIQTRSVVAKLRSAAKQGRMRTLEQVAVAPKAEYDLVSFILGDGSNVPSWTDILSKILEAAIADATSAAPQPQAAPQQPKPQPQQPQAQQSPTDRFGGPQQASHTPPVNPTAQQTPPPASTATPPPSSGNGTAASAAATNGGPRRRIR